MDKILTEKLSLRLIQSGAFILILGCSIFLWKENFNFTNQIDSSKIGQLGDFIGGLTGSIWALAGVILFYIALRDQREDFKTNRNVLNSQTQALQLQIKEFELQRFELEETRKVFKIQSDTLKTQQFESTFFNLINLHHQIVNAIDLDDYAHGKTTGRDCFEKFFTQFSNYFHPYKRDSGISDEKKIITDSYSKFYSRNKSDLGHYFRHLYHILKFIDTSLIENKKDYSNLVRAQLSSNELLLLYYNCIHPNGSEKFKPLIEKYQFLKNMPVDKDSILDVSHLKYYSKNAFA